MNITWKSLVVHLNKIKFNDFEVLHEGKLKPITHNHILKTGLEFADLSYRKEIDGIVLWSEQEYKYLMQFNETEIENKLIKIFELSPPAIVISQDFVKYKILTKVAKKYDTSLIRINSSNAFLTNLLDNYLAEKLAPSEFLHANLLVIYGRGVLIKGQSGIGKSEITLELLKHGHLFVADDAIICKNIHDKIIGFAIKRFFPFLEVRGIGMINIAKIFGIEKVEKSTEINLVIDLVPFSNKNEFERLGKEMEYETILGVKVPKFLLPVSNGKKISDLIEISVSQLKLIESGYNSYEDLVARSKTIDEEF